MMITSELSE